MELSESVNKF